jgi:hypothetical protein
LWLPENFGTSLDFGRDLSIQYHSFFSSRFSGPLYSCE